MILFHEIIEGFDLPPFHVFRQDCRGFEIRNGFRRSSMLLHVDHPRNRCGRGGDSRTGGLGPLLLTRTRLRSPTCRHVQCLVEKACGRLGIAHGTQEKLTSVPFGIPRPLEVDPPFFACDGRLIHAPGVEARSAALLPLWCVPLNPAEERCVIDAQPALPHHLFPIARTQGIPKIATDTHENDLGLEVPPFEGKRLSHHGVLLPFSPSFTRSAYFLQHNRVFGVFEFVVGKQG